MSRSVSIIQESWPLKKPFVISRGSRSETTVVKVTLLENGAVGLGEGVPSPRYNETIESVVTQIQAIQDLLACGLCNEELHKILPHGAARNAVDAALWDLKAKQTGQDVGHLTTLGWPSNIITAQTISIGNAEEMGAEAKELASYPVLKLKLNSKDIVTRVRAVRENAPSARLLIDANESWSFDELKSVMPDLCEMGVAVVEQPLEANRDNALFDYASPIPLFADESCHVRADLQEMTGKYQGINIKLDKTGGLTKAIELLYSAKDHGFEIMVGCMLSTSLGIAPALFLAQHAQYIDLDASALLARDRSNAIINNNGHIDELPTGLWGGGSLSVTRKR